MSKQAELAILDARRRLNIVENEMKLLANNIAIEPQKFLRQDLIVPMLRRTVDVLASFDSILEIAQVEERACDHV